MKTKQYFADFKNQLNLRNLLLSVLAVAGMTGCVYVSGQDAEVNIEMSHYEICPAQSPEDVKLINYFLDEVDNKYYRYTCNGEVVRFDLETNS